MARIPFDQLPPDARLWIFAASRRLSDEERQRVLAEADAFIEQWTAHATLSYPTGVFLRFTGSLNQYESGAGDRRRDRRSLAHHRVDRRSGAAGSDRPAGAGHDRPAST